MIQGWLHRDDGLAAFKNMRTRSGDNIRKVFCEILADLGLRITVQSNLKVVNYVAQVARSMVRRKR